MRPLAVRLAADVFAALLLLGAGLALTAFVPRLRARGRLERLGWGWLFGVAWLGTGAWVSSLVFHLTIRPALFVALAALPPAALLLARPRPLRRGASGRVHPAARAAFALGALATIALLFEALALPVGDWDGRMTWGAQARWVAAERTVLPAALTDPAFSAEHPRYPLLLPLLQALPMEVAGETEDGRIPRPLYPPFFAAAALVLHGAARRFAGSRAAGAAALLFVLAPFVAFENHGGAAGTYSDLPLAALLSGGLFLLLGARGGMREGLAAGLLLAGAVLAKNEGLPLALAALAGAGLVAWRRRGRGRADHLRRLAAAAAAVLMAAALLVAWKARIPNRNDEDYLRMLLDRPQASALLASLRSALPVAAREVLSFRAWGVLWIAVPLLLVLLPGWRRHPAAGALLLVAAAGTGVALAAWTVHPDPAALVAVTASRAALQVLPPLLLLVALASRSSVR